MSYSGEPIEFAAARLSGDIVETTERRVRDLGGIFEDKVAFRSADQDHIVYRVDSYAPVEPGTEGGLFFGVTHLMPGVIGREYYMTKGHFHAIRNRGEFYWGISGCGVLVLMDETRADRIEEVRPGSLHYVPGDTAHRLVNTGDAVLDVGACWPSDAGHDYSSIAEVGFSLRVLKGDAGPEIENR